jgi:hypothetical protein
MILGMATATFTLIHVLISLLAIGSGLIVLLGMIGAKRLDGWTAFFLLTTVLTSVTGFLFPIKQLTPGLIVGTISLIVLAVAILARYTFHLAGVWRATYVITAALALYLNTFVLVVQSFEKVDALKALAPTQKEPPFMAAQLVVLAIFIVLSGLAVKRFRLESPRVPAARAA